MIRLYGLDMEPIGDILFGKISLDIYGVQHSKYVSNSIYYLIDAKNKAYLDNMLSSVDMLIETVGTENKVYDSSYIDVIYLNTNMGGFMEVHFRVKNKVEDLRQFKLERVVNLK
jgi:hypothetical protein